MLGDWVGGLGGLVGGSAIGVAAYWLAIAVAKPSEMRSTNLQQHDCICRSIAHVLSLCDAKVVKCRYCGTANVLQPSALIRYALVVAVASAARFVAQYCLEDGHQKCCDGKGRMSVEN